jgi:hypothetical protein
MTALLPTLIVTAMIAAPAPGDKPGMPDGPTPTIATVAAIDKDAGTCTLRTIVIKMVTANETVPQNLNGMIVQRVVPVTRLIREMTEQKVSIKDTPVSDAEGNKVAEEDVWKRLTTGATVVVSTDGNKVDSGYLTAFKKETLVLQPVRR